jgi:GGDEF domain-containing protein
MAAVAAYLGAAAAAAIEHAVPGLGGTALAALAAAAAVFAATMALLAPILARHAGEAVRRVFPRVVRAEAPLALLMAPSGLMLDELVDRSPFLLLTVAAPLTALWLYQRSQAEALAALRMAQLDHLTGLGNRRAFEARLERALRDGGSGARRRAVSLLLVDVDDFKLVNDAYGHPVGDALLARLAACLRDGEGFRLGGDEFAVLLTHADAAEARRAADAIVRRADDALYAATEGGKGRVAAAGLADAA